MCSSHNDGNLHHENTHFVCAALLMPDRMKSFRVPRLELLVTFSLAGWECGSAMWTHSGAGNMVVLLLDPFILHKF